MNAYDAQLAPSAFGLHNTGAICYFNSLLQVLAGCPAFVGTVQRHAAGMRDTATGSALLAYLDSATGPSSSRGDVEHQSSRVLTALCRDLASRRPRVRFGAGQESASEALCHLLDMLEPDDAGALTPVADVFLHRYRCSVRCDACHTVTTSPTNHAINFNLFHLDDSGRRPPATPAEFAAALRLQVDKVRGYDCPSCGDKRDGARVYRLSMAPDVLFCMFNLYEGYGGARRARYFPPALEFPAADGGAPLAYILVGQVEHSGSLSGGHYWARALRAGGRVFLLNDTGVSPSSFACTPGTYIVVYHYAGRSEPGAAPADDRADGAAADYAGTPPIGRTSGEESAPARTSRGAGSGGRGRPPA